MDNSVGVDCGTQGQPEWKGWGVKNGHYCNSTDNKILKKIKTLLQNIKGAVFFKSTKLANL